MYVRVAFADMDGDGLVDLAFADRSGRQVAFFRNTGQRDEGNLPLFAPYGSIETPFATIEHLILQDITGNGAVDLVVNGHLIANLAATGAPFQPGPPQDLGSGPHIAFLDLDGDGRLELIGLEGRASRYPPPDQPHALCWRCLTSTNPIQYGPPQTLSDVPDAADCTQIAATPRATPRPSYCSATPISI